MRSSGGCTYSFDAAAWERENGAETPLNGTWQCPHDPYEGHDRCLFHLSPDERQASGITPQTVAEEFRQKVRTASPKERWFVGVELDLALNYSDVQAESRHPVHLHHVTVHDTFNISFATFQVHLVVSHSDIGLLDAVSAEFNYECYFAESDIEEANFRAAVFEDYVEFDGTTLGQSRLTSVQFRGGTSFEDTVFDGETDFSFSTFGRRTNFRNATFRSDAYFARILMENGSFSGVTFRGNADFTHAEFDKCAFDTVFENVSFEGTRFLDEIDFAAAAFEDELIVDMSDCEIRGGRMIVHRDEANTWANGGETESEEEISPLTAF